MSSDCHISTSSTAIHDDTAQGLTPQSALRIAAPHKPPTNCNYAAAFRKNHEGIEEGDDYEPDKDMCSGNSLLNPPAASRLLSREASSPNSTGQKRSALDCEESEAPTEAKRGRISFLHSATTTKPSICSILPEALWTEIFSLLHPADLGRQRRVCKLFKKCLEDEGIWRRSRNRHLPDHPKPVFGLTEWEMLCVMWGTGCMLCEDGAAKRKGNNRPTGVKTGAIVYWPFRVRCCKGCLEGNTIKVREENFILLIICQLTLN